MIGWNGKKTSRTPVSRRGGPTLARRSDSAHRRVAARLAENWKAKIKTAYCGACFVLGWREVRSSRLVLIQGRTLRSPGYGLHLWQRTHTTGLKGIEGDLVIFGIEGRGERVWEKAVKTYK
jgi:hypothetical protein